MSSSGSKWFVLVFPSGLYSGDCFDKLVVLFISKICVCECPVLVNCQLFFLSFSFFSSFSFYKYVFGVFVCLRGCTCPCMYIYFRLLFFSFITLFL